MSTNASISLQEIILDQQQRIATLERELTKARKDTARLDWLEGKADGMVRTQNPEDYEQMGWTVDGLGTMRAWWGETLREAIDAARTKDAA